MMYERVRALLARAAMFRAADAFGVLRYRVTRRWPTRDEVRALFPHAGAKTAARISALEERNHVLVRMIARDGIEPVRAFTSAGDSLAALEGPAILATFHVGAVHAIGAVLGLFLYWLPVYPQRNAHWIALLLPIHLGLLQAFRARR